MFNEPLTQEYTNWINKALETLTTKGIAVNIQFKSERLGAEGDYASYSTMTSAIYINTSMSVETIAAETAKDYSNRWFSTNDPLHILVHEIAHFLHEFTYRPTSIRPDWQTIATEQVSRYAAVSYKELIAEVFTGLVFSKTYSTDVMDLYRQLGGPDIP